MNENINFLLSENNDSLLSSSRNLSMSYSKTDNLSQISSVFRSFEDLNAFIHSVPQSDNESLYRKSFESDDPRILEKNDLILITPAYSSENILKNSHQENIESRLNPIINVVPVEEGASKDSSLRKSQILDFNNDFITTEKQFDINTNQVSICSCVWCMIF